MTEPAGTVLLDAVVIVPIVKPAAAKLLTAVLYDSKAIEGTAINWLGVA